ncbi:hypothetical protein DU52_15500 [Methanosarcina mazei]|uniref:Uncharacterized protein n=1 Tax=Methanosarcina mazei TaxID=2209 RepID=A0A0F8EZ19_METMZ|nr:hypothetical protein DU52_15500 [Methanosarcina mazei]
MGSCGACIHWRQPGLMQGKNGVCGNIESFYFMGKVRKDGNCRNGDKKMKIERQIKITLTRAESTGIINDILRLESTPNFSICIEHLQTLKKCILEE